jgi:hypothetical protein
MRRRFGRFVVSLQSKRERSGRMLRTSLHFEQGDFCSLRWVRWTRDCRLEGFRINSSQYYSVPRHTEKSLDRNEATKSVGEMLGLVSVEKSKFWWIDDFGDLTADSHHPEYKVGRCIMRNDMQESPISQSNTRLSRVQGQK